MRGFDSHLTLQKMEVFCVVADLQSVTRAADFLCISQPVVTAHIRSLEAKLGARLIRREGRGITLTSTGHRVLKWAQETVTRTRELERDLGGATDIGPGKAVVAASMSAGSYQVPGIVCDFQAAHPDGLVQVAISNPQVALEATRAGACDFAVTIIAPTQNLDGLTAQPLWIEPLWLVSAPASRWVGDSMDREAVADVPFVSTSNSTVMQQLEEGQLRANGVPSRRIVLELGHPEAQKEAVRRDVGVCFFLRSSVAQDVRRGELRVVKTPGLALAIPLYVVYRKDKAFSPYQLALRHYVEAARPAGVTPFDRAVHPPMLQFQGSGADLPDPLAGAS
jgi:DNA-binding transcriptional LysR family regulator